MTPAIAVLPAWYTAAQLRAYRNGWRGTESDDFTSRKMTLFAEALASDDALQAVAEYAAGLGDAARGSGRRVSHNLHRIRRTPLHWRTSRAAPAATGQTARG